MEAKRKAGDSQEGERASVQVANPAARAEKRVRSKGKSDPKDSETQVRVAQNNVSGLYVWYENSTPPD